MSEITAAEDERHRIIGIILERMDTHKRFVDAAHDAGAMPIEGFYFALAELTGLLRAIQK